MSECVIISKTNTILWYSLPRSYWYSLRMIAINPNHKATNKAIYPTFILVDSHNSLDLSAISSNYSVYGNINGIQWCY